MDWGTLAPIGGLLVAVAIGAVPFLLSRRRAAKLREAWEQFALLNGLTFEPARWFSLHGHPKVNGEYRSRPITLTNVTESDGESSRTYSTITANILFNPVPSASLSISPVNIFNKIGRAMGMTDISIGDPDFDDRHSVKSSPPELATSLLGDEMLRHELTQLNKWQSIQLKGGDLTFNSRIDERDITRLERIFNLLSDLADAIEGKQK